MNVIFVVLDTLRADHLSCYGYKRQTSPNLDEFVGQGLLFRQMFAPDVPTQPAYTSIYTSRYALHHGIISHGVEAQQLREDIPTLPQLLQAQGIVTVALDNLINMKTHFARGYEYYILTPSLQFLTAGEVNVRALPWLKAYHRKPFSLFLHYWDSHTPYLPPEKYRRKFYEGDEFDLANKSMEGFEKSVFYPFMKRWLIEA